MVGVGGVEDGCGGALGLGGAGGTGEPWTEADTACDELAMSRLVVSATDTVMGGGATGAAGVIVTWAVGVVGGTNFICGGRTDAGAGVGAAVRASGD